MRETLSDTFLRPSTVHLGYGARQKLAAWCKCDAAGLCACGGCLAGSLLRFTREAPGTAEEVGVAAWATNLASFAYTHLEIPGDGGDLTLEDAMSNTEDNVKRQSRKHHGA